MFYKAFLSVLAVSGVIFCQAADLTTESGKVYKNVELRKIAGGCVQIVHDKGSAAIELYDLPDNFIAALSIRQRYSLQSLADIKLVNGKTYYKTSINSLGGGFISITHLDGIDKIAFKDLPTKYVSTLTRKQIEAISKVHEPKKEDKKSSAEVKEKKAPAVKK